MTILIATSQEKRPTTQTINTIDMIAWTQLFTYNLQSLMIFSMRWTLSCLLRLLLSTPRFLEAFEVESLIELAMSYPDDFDSTQLKDLGRELTFFTDNVWADERFSSLIAISALARLMVDTTKRTSFPLVYRLLKLVLVLSITTASVERYFSAMNIVKTMLRNRIWDGFMNDCIICFVEPEFLATIPTDDVIVRFHKMEDSNRRGKI
jgi:hypothetical protein